MAHKYSSLWRNHGVWPGREQALFEFLAQKHNGQRHKAKHAVSANSEDALTWTCFDALQQLPGPLKARAIAELWEDAYADELALPPDLCNPSDHGIEILVGKTYEGTTTGDTTEVDVSIEAPGVLGGGVLALLGLLAWLVTAALEGRRRT